MKSNLENLNPNNKTMDTWEKFAKAFNYFSKQMGKKIKTYGLTQPQFSVIEALGNLGSMKIGELNNNMIFNGGNMTLVLDQLEKQDYIRRTNSPSDRRAIIIELTDQGHKLFSDIYPDHTEHVLSLMNRLSEEEQFAFSDLLSRLID